MANIKQITIPPPPPLPPPLPLSLLYTSTIDRSLNIRPSSEQTIIEKDELCEKLKRLLAADEKFNEIFFLSNQVLKPQLQIGPKCGLVALSMASTITSNPATVDKIFEIAYSRGYTKQGEIFNVEFLKDLAENVCGFNTNIIKGGLKTHMHCIIHNLQQQYPVLIPYDCDHNHSPCCKKGFRAHWAVISGFVVLTSKCKTCKINCCDSCNAVKIEPVNDTLCRCIDISDGFQNKINFYKNNEELIISKEVINNKKNFNINRGRIYLIGRHGKSKHSGLWSFNQMAESNDNLIMFPNTKNHEEFVIPNGGLVEGLKGKALILKPSKTKLG